LKTKLLYFFCLAALCLHAQKDLALEKGKCAPFRGYIHAYGFKNTTFVIYKLKSNLQVLDSLSYDLGRNKAADYLSVDTDTLHGTLNFYLQKKDKQNVTLLRIDRHFKLAGEFKNVDVTKLDPFALFDHQKFSYKRYVYAVKTAFDSTGKQYYLSKYQLQAANDKPFDYKFLWQFNFEKKHIRNVHVFYADTNCVLAYVHVSDGNRKGQWVLKVNANTGLIIKGKKISSNAALNYRYGSHFLDTVNKNLFVLGQLTQGDQLASATPTLFILQFDSLLSLDSQKQVVQRITAANPKAKGGTYIFQVGKLKLLSPNTYQYQIDLYKNNLVDFKYTNTYVKQFSFEDEAIVSDPVTVKEFPEIENFYFTTDKKDLNGKLFSDTVKSADRLFYVPPVFKVNHAFRLNSDEMPVWILRKTDPKTNTINFSSLKPGLKVYETKAISTNAKEEEPGMLLFGKDSYVLFYSKGGTILHLEIGNW
jgi:hypothetical protein